MSRIEDIEKIISTNFGIQKFSNEIDTESEFFKRLQSILANRIEFFINTDVEKLFQILYRIDVPQGKTDQAFDLGEIKKISLKLAELIINRQLQKIDYSRNFYNDKNKG